MQERTLRIDQIEKERDSLKVKCEQVQKTHSEIITVKDESFRKLSNENKELKGVIENLQKQLERLNKQKETTEWEKTHSLNSLYEESALKDKQIGDLNVCIKHLI